VNRARSSLLLLGCAVLLVLACGRFGGGRDVAAPPARFRIAGLEEAEVRAAFEALQRAVRAEDREAIADLVALPLRVGGGRVRTRDELLREHGTIWTPAVQRAVLAQRFETLFVNAQGVMLGDGVVWLAGVCASGPPREACLDPQVRIIAVNPGVATAR
jgi:hypothetical protein